MNIFGYLARDTSKQYTAVSGVEPFLCGHAKGRRDLSAEHSMRMSVGYGDPARGQARKL